MFAPQPPRKRSSVEVFQWIKLSPGGKFGAWLAGPAVGVHVHWNDGSKPCRRELTNGALPCKFCAAGLAPSWRSYVPLWDGYGVRRAVAVNEDYAPMLEGIPLHAAVLVKKLTLWGSPLAVEEDDRRHPYQSPNGGAVVALEIRPWLLQVWHDHELAAWVQHHPIAELPLPVPPAEEAKKRFDRKTQEQRDRDQAEKAEAVEDDRKARERLAELMKRDGVKPSKNGKHHG